MQKALFGTRYGCLYKSIEKHWTILEFEAKVLKSI